MSGERFARAGATHGRFGRNDAKIARGPTRLTRGDFLRLVGSSVGALTLSSCGVPFLGDQGSLPKAPRIGKTGHVREHALEAAPLRFEVGGRKLQTWGYNGGVPGPEIRVTEGDTLRAKVLNRLSADTTIHWHGLPVPNAMDGVPHVTQPSIKSGEAFTYEFVVPTAGTYVYHSHVGLQLDRGLYGPLVVDAKEEELDYDREYVLLLDDWLDGVSGSPQDKLEELQSSGSGMGGGMMGGMGGGMMGGGRGQGGPGSSGAVDYPLYLINGHAPDDPETLNVRRREKARLRLINPAGETTFRFAVGGHKLTVTHSDGQPVEPVEVDVVRIGPGERYDVIVEANNPGVWQIAAVPEGKNGLGRAILRYEESGQSSPPPEDSRPQELSGRFLSYGDLRTTSEKTFPPDVLFGGPDHTLDLALSGGMGNYVWTIDGQAYPNADPIQVSQGEWVRFHLTNRSMMAHPMHLHGHFFQLQNGTERGPFKDTVLVEAHMGEATFDFVADNPGDWLFHCHIVYHMESGMTRVVSYGG
jgi:FtsP/CotA-like multicopper oxidase with cupredoxin domain